MSILKKKVISLNSVKTIGILADCGCPKDWESNFPRLLGKVWEEYSPQLFIVIGDIALNGWSFDYKKVIKYMKSIPADWAAVPGNHDQPLIVFRKYFGAVRKVIDVGKWRFICINTAGKNFSKKEAEWIRMNIRENTFILSHLPPGLKGWTFYSLSEENTVRFMEIIEKYHERIKGAFFGHIHGYSEKEYRGIPFIITGGSAESRVIRDNRYNENTDLSMMIFDVEKGGWNTCKIK